MRKVFFILLLGLFSCRSFAGNVIVGKSFSANIYGFIDYESGWNKNTSSIFGSNTSYYSGLLKDKIVFNSRARGRIGIRVVSLDKKTTGNIMIDLCQDGFKLKFAYVKHKIGNKLSIVVGKDWSLVDVRYFHFSSFSLKPYAAGFQGSKRIPQVTATYKTSYKYGSLSISLGMEHRNSKNGVVEGKNVSSTGDTISSSNIYYTRTTLPAIVGRAKIYFKTFDYSSNVMVYYEALPVYLGYAEGEAKEFSYLYGFAMRINRKKLSFIGEYLHASGMTGVAGLQGNCLRTFSYVWNGNKVIKRESDTLGLEAVIKLSHFLYFVPGYVYLKFYNRSSNDNYFLKNEVKSVRTLYLSAVFKITRVTRLFLIFDNIKAKYIEDSETNVGFKESIGDQILMGYRMYF